MYQLLDLFLCPQHGLPSLVFPIWGCVVPYFTSFQRWLKGFVVCYSKRVCTICGQVLTRRMKKDHRCMGG